MNQQTIYKDDLQYLMDAGIEVNNKTLATDFLKTIDVHRFCNYSTVIKSNSFTEVKDVYSFDDELQLFLWKWIEPIELRTRKQFSRSIASTGNVLGYRNSDLFKNSDSHARALRSVDREIKRARKNNMKFVNESLETYGDLPVFDAVEIASFGTLSKLCGNLKQEYVKPIAQDFGLSNYCFTNWIRHLVVVRNICAHHNRFYGLPMRMPPKLLKKDSQHFSFKQFPTFIVLKRIYENIDDFELMRFLVELNDIIEKYSHVSLTPMGFPDKWQDALRD